MLGAQQSFGLAKTSKTSDTDQWPSLSQNSSAIQDQTGEDTSRDASESKNNDEEGSPALLISFPKPVRLSRLRSASTPNLRKLAEACSMVETDKLNALTDPAVPSFREMLLTKAIKEEKEEEEDIFKESPKPKVKTKPTFVVTPIRRCSMSSPNLRALSSFEEGSEEVLGDTDAMEYYNRKASGYNGRKNGLKVRPDEAKRLDMILQKKDMQRKAQGIKR
mmetsp:Transcript_9809/g.14431  ORF Transcript_9809/g.14431 Transcript_9809/m.14431 type:complete len:220 (+) Transcript_9809:200-859(+)|eukprot:CAMPEP_0194215618 /NCGR_PEP_ID=MMETSP0156-20130528/17555_1 /TAXON_ID=33649 /ORGANISM="Thalassionema nitzschioides, Strain L26-B" /LENGTH=219 /DNA_ID=CAMNT_0038944183 /DNA_START=200 /DNA_END=859 /DNA_ORIENTATION=-